MSNINEPEIDDASEVTETKPVEEINVPSVETASTAPPGHLSTDADASQEKSQTKIDVLLKATGDAPIMKRKKWLVEKVKKIGWVIEFVKKYIKCEPSESLFLYVNQSFAPSPDTDIGTLYDCFGSDGKLVLHYCKTQAWG